MVTAKQAPGEQIRGSRLGLLAAGRTLRGPLGTTGLVVVAGVIVMLFSAQQYTGTVFVLAFCYAIVTAGMAVQIGFSQQIAFSQSVFMGLGAYGVALLNTDLSIPSLLAAPMVMAGAGLAALLLGSVVTRASGLALAVATLMLPLIAVGYLSSAGYLGGSVGMPLTGSLWPSSSTTVTAAGNGLVVVVVLGLVVFVATRILSSDVGLELYVLGVDERTAAAMGVETPRRKLELFVLGSGFAALGGALYAGTQLFVPATLAGPTAELALLMMLFVGGRRSILGAVAGALVIQYLSGASNWVSVNILIVEGALLTAVLLVDPEGLAGIAGSLLRRVRGTGQAVAGASPLEVQPPAGGAERGARGQVCFGKEWADRWGGRPDHGPPLLECDGVSQTYGGLRVLDQVGLALPARGLFGLCGPNGAGKSTLLGVIGGTVSPSRGRVLLDGAEVTRLSPQQHFRLGLGRTFQAVHLITGRTVLDNVAVSCLGSHQASMATRVFRNRLAEAREKAAEALGYLDMGHLGRYEVSALTLEHQRMVELARAIAAKPRLLLLDEPASGLSEPQRERLAGVLRTVGAMTCVLLVEHDLDLVAQVSQKIFVLARGQLVFDGSPEDFRASAVVNSLLIGL